MSSVSAIELTPQDVRDYTASRPLAFRIARLWNRWSWRGKGAVPRWIGRTWGQRWKILCQTASGVPLAVEPTSLDVYLSILRDGAWEPWIVRAALAALRPGDVFYDIGANVGCIALEIAAAASVEVHAFEPQPRLAHAVAVSAKLAQLARVHVYAAAVGDHEGTIPLCLPGHSVHASIRTATRGERTILVPVLTIDGLVARGQLPPPSVIKVDVEGAEFQVLRGAQQTLQIHRPILLFEVNDNATRFGYQKDELLKWISEQADYRFLQISPSDIMATPADRAEEIAGRYRASERPAALA